MWICLNEAFFSIVEPSPTDLAEYQPSGDVLLVRARRKGDIEKVFPSAEVMRVPGRDYLYRAFVGREKVAHAVADQIRGITYENFKNSVRDDKLHDVYARFWHGHASLQEIPPYSTRRNAAQGGSAVSSVDLESLDAVASKACCYGDGDWFPPEALAAEFEEDDAAFIAAASPAVVLELVRRLRAAEALVSSRIEQIPADAMMVAVFTDMSRHHVVAYKAFADAVKQRCYSSEQTMVAFFPVEARIEALSDGELQLVGLTRQEVRRV